ncbi:DUF3050 domain-containing protein [Amycolatopsis albispora]|uniref:Heme oxygenase n=1 Tax=Amycolatopsis albispora TaxID=1804986 RepID=A0A344LIX3_9PSEU|nr:DUF3050 domain-containing protein [Amycolatopsis albispora]AXB47997.1 heme oxygenase [Amycolatopsis albispora]
MSGYQWKSAGREIERLRVSISGIRAEVTGHRLYGLLRRRADVATFMTHHVFAVWESMSLLKALQGRLTCVRVPWVPRDQPIGGRLVNELVLVEESDALECGFTSHFELYRQAMAAAGADTAPIDEFLGLLRSGIPVPRALVTADAPEPAAEFVRASWSLVSEGTVHQQAAAFAFGRAELGPAMFAQVAAEDRLALFRLYLDRHVVADQRRHTPMAMRVLAGLCGDDESKWRECAEAAREVLRARVRLWDGVCAALDRRLTSVPAPG